MELKKKNTYTGGDGALLSHDSRNFRRLCTPSEGYRCSGASLSTWSTQYDSVLNKDIKIDEKKTHNGRGLVHYHPGIGETVDIRITPPVLRRSRPSTQQQPTFRRSGRTRHISPIQSSLPYKEPDLSTQEPPLTPPQPTPCTEYSVYSSHSLLLGPPTQLRTARQWSLSSAEHAAYSSHSFCTQHTALFFYASYSSHFYAA